ncbi:MAG: hypothetical protein U0235_11820 [Polyangiaceae bacterium]
MFIKLGSWIALTGLSLAAVACSGADVSDDLSQGDTDDELRTSSVTEFSVYRSTGFTPPPPPGSCRPSGHWTVNLATSAFDADACIDGKTVKVSRALSADEVRRAKSGLSKVRTAKRPTACPTDAPVRSLDVTRSGTETHYVEQRSACGGANAVTSTSIGALVDLMEELSTAGAAQGSQTYEGKLMRVMAIGGETTGKVIQTANGRFELDFASADSSAFVNGQQARVVGTPYDKQGVEIPMRHLVKVEDIVVCPVSGHLNCMPPIANKITQNQCANTDWLRTNCGGISIVF